MIRDTALPAGGVGLSAPASRMASPRTDNYAGPGSPDRPEDRDHTTYDAVDITKSFSGVAVLKQVSVTFQAGEVHSLVGQNGAGKSTLLKILSGLYPFDKGQLSLNGQKLASLTPAEALKAGIYLVPQEPRLMPDLSVAENLYLGALPRGRLRINVDWRRMNNEADYFLSAVGLDVPPRTLAIELPLARQQLLECAKALARGCRVIFFDEPTSPLTPHETDKLFTLINDLRSRRITLGFISHRLDEIENMSDRITVLRDGVVVSRYKRGEAGREDLVADMIGKQLATTKRTRTASRVGQPVLQVDGLASEPVVKGISIEVRSGEVVGLGGLVGSGRTELAETIFGLRAPSSGTVHVNGRDITGASPQACIDAGLIYLSEDRGRNGIFAEVDLVRNTTSAIVRRLPRVARMIRPQTEHASARKALERADVRAARMDLPVKSLSGGNQQKLLFARWMLASPAVAIFDEPTRGVDIGAKEGIYDTIDGLAADGLATLVICSELEELVRLCDRVYIVYEGRIVGHLTGDDITTQRIGRLAVDQVR